MKIKSISELEKEIFKTEEKSELRKKFEKRAPRQDDSLRHLVKFPKLSGRIYKKEIVSLDTGDQYGIAVLNMQHDEYTKIDNQGFSKEVKGITHKADYQIFDIRNKKKLFEFGPETYRDGDGSIPDRWELAYEKGKILEEKENQVIFGIASQDQLKIIAFNKKEGIEKILETYDLAKEKEKEAKRKNFRKAFHDFDLEAIRDFMEEPKYFTKVKKLSEDYALVMMYDPYGDTGRRHAKVKLLIRDKGIVDLGIHEKQFSGSAVTQGFDLRHAKIYLKNNKVMLDYIIEETQTKAEGLGLATTTLGRKPYHFEFTGNEFPRSKDLLLDEIIEQHKEQWLSYGNLHPLPIVTEGDTATYPYNIQHIREKNKAYVSVIKVIDCERYDRGMIFDPQLMISIYEITEIDGKKPFIKEIFSATSLRGDQEGGLVLEARKRNQKLYFLEEPSLERISDREIKISYTLRGKEEVKKEYIIKT